MHLAIIAIQLPIGFLLNIQLFCAWQGCYYAFCKCYTVINMKVLSNLISEREKPSFRCSKTHTYSHNSPRTHATTQEYKNTQYRHGKESKKKKTKKNIYIYIYSYIYEINNTEQNKTHTQTRTRQINNQMFQSTQSWARKILCEESIAFWAALSTIARQAAVDCWIVFWRVDGLWKIMTQTTNFNSDILTSKAKVLILRADTPSFFKLLDFRSRAACKCSVELNRHVSSRRWISCLSALKIMMSERLMVE